MRFVTIIILLFSFMSAPCEEPLTLERAVSDFGCWLASPLYGEPTGYIAASGCLVLTGIAFANDDSWGSSIREWSENKNRDRAASLASSLCDTETIVIGIAGLGLIGIAFNNHSIKEEAWALAESTLYSALLFQAIKYSTGRARPTQSDKSYDFHGFSTKYDSFPSGHSTAAGAIAGCLIRRHPQLEVIIPSATLALAVGISRIMLSRHHPSDVTAGLALGFWSGYQLGKSSLNINHSSAKGVDSWNVSLSLPLE